MSEREEHIKSMLQRLPESPGSYQYFDEHGTVIYVGKAKNLKRRVSSYFNREHDSRKTAILVSKIWDIHYTVVKTEAEALLLENQLIKQFQPRYNVLLKYSRHAKLTEEGRNTLVPTATYRPLTDSWNCSGTSTLFAVVISQ